MGRITLVLYLFLSLLVFVSACTQQSEKHDRSYAVVLNNKAIKILVYADEKDLNPEERSLRVLKLLDSATAIDDNYYAAHVNKLSSFIELKRYDNAISIIDKVIKADPKSFYTLIKGGIIHQDYLNDTIRAKIYFKRANILATNNLKISKNIDNDYKVAISLMYLKDKNSAINYLLNVKKYYLNDLKTVNTIDLLQRLIENTPSNKQNNFNMFKQYHSEKY